MKCLLLLGHRWWPVAVDHYRDMSYCGPGEAGSPSTSVTSRCERCGKLRVDLLWMAGFVTLEELQQRPKPVARVLRLVRGKEA